MTKHLRIDELYAFIAVDKDDDSEGIIGMLAPGSDVFHPFVGADMERVDSLRPHAQRIATELGATVRLCRFSTRELLEIINP